MLNYFKKKKTKNKKVKKKLNLKFSIHINQKSFFSKAIIGFFLCQRKNVGKITSFLWLEAFLI